MSVLIKGMEMPRHCGECGIEWCNRWKKLIVAGMSIAKSRPKDCPLVPVPPHGRLIDLDAIPQSAWRGSKEDLIDELIMATAVIEAEDVQ